MFHCLDPTRHGLSHHARAHSHAHDTRARLSLSLDNETIALRVGDNVDKNCSGSLPASEMGSHEAVPVKKKTTSVGFEDVGRDAEERAGEGGLAANTRITVPLPRTSACGRDPLLPPFAPLLPLPMKCEPGGKGGVPPELGQASHLELPTSCYASAGARSDGGGGTTQHHRLITSADGSLFATRNLIHELGVDHKLTFCVDTNGIRATEIEVSNNSDSKSPGKLGAAHVSEGHHLLRSSGSSTALQCVDATWKGECEGVHCKLYQPNMREKDEAAPTTVGR